MVVLWSKKMLKMLIAGIVLICSGFAYGNKIPKTLDELFWLNAKIESNHKANPKPSPGTEWEKARGILQIRPIMVREVNRLLKRKKNKQRYTLKDRLSVSKSREMYMIYMKFWCPRKKALKKGKLTDVVRAARLWNGLGIKNTGAYARKVRKHLKDEDWRPKKSGRKSR